MAIIPETAIGVGVDLFIPDLFEKAAALNSKRGPMHHDVKSWTFLFDEIKAGRKTADMRNKTERDYRVGDTMTLHRYDQTTGQYTKETLDVEIMHIISNDTPCAMSSVALHRDYCILSLKLLLEDR